VSPIQPHLNSTSLAFGVARLVLNGVESLELEGRATIEVEWAGRVTGLGDERVEMATSAGLRGLSSDSPKNSASAGDFCD